MTKKPSKHSEKMRVSLLSTSAIECLPPWINWMKDQRWNDYQVSIWSPFILNLNLQKCSFPNINIERKNIEFSQGGLRNLWYKLKMQWYAFRHLLRLSPQVIVTIENDVLPAVWLYLLFHRKCKLFMHFYEYLAPEDPIARWGYVVRPFIRPMLQKAHWVSQCNEERLAFFAKDYKLPQNKCHVFHNYPPSWWWEHYRERDALNRPARVILIGAISLQTMFVKEFSDFVDRCAGAIRWDIIAPDASTEVLQYFEQRKSPWITLSTKRVVHQDIPKLFSNYDIGILLYKGTIRNFAYAESNKFYEYLSCGLDVWVPDCLIPLRKYQTTDTYPKISVLDFTQLSAVNVDQLLSHKGLVHRKYNFSAEHAADSFFEDLQKI